jgi:hypothetical protein
MAEKVIAEKEIGDYGATAGLYFGEGELSVKLSYPIAKILEPIAQLADKAIDQLDKWIPGDQKAIADKLKKEMREELAELMAKEVTK